MTRTILGAVLALFALPSLAQTTTITASNIQNLAQEKVAAGYLGLMPVDDHMQPMAFTACGGGQVMPTTHYWPITNGAISGVVVPDTQCSTPSNVGYLVIIANQNKATIYQYAQPIHPTGSTWSLDAWSPTSTVLASPANAVQSSTIAPTGNCTEPSLFYYGAAGDPKTLVPCDGGVWGSFANLGGGGGAQADWTAVTGPSVILHKPTLATVATTGAYGDLSGTPTIPAAPVNSDWNAVSGLAQILNKPSIPAPQVQSDWNAVSGLAQILNKPSIPAAVSIDGNTGDFTFSGNGVSHSGNAYTFTGSGTGIGSIAWALPSFMTASPTTLSGSGTQTFALATQAANLVFAGPSSGVDAAPTFRALVAADIPSLNYQAPLGFTAVANTVTVNGHALSSNVTVSATDITTGTLPHAQLPTLLSGDIPNNAANTSGTSAGLSGTQTAHFVYAAPSGSNGTASFRALVAGDIPSLSYDASGAATTAQSNAEAAFTGDVSKSANAFATTVVKVNGGSIPTSATSVGTNSSGQFVAVTPGIAGRTVTTTSDTIASGDRLASVTYNSSSAVAVSLPSAASLGSNFAFVVGNLGSGTVTITPTTSVINGISTLTVAQNESCAINSQDNTDYVARCGYSVQTSGGASTPATTSLLKGNGSANGVVAATAGTDYDAAGAASTAQSNAEAAFTGDVAKSANAFATTVTKINGTSLAGLATGLIKNTTTTGVPSIAVAGTDYQAPISMGTGVATFLATPNSANFAAAIMDETGTGVVVLANTPTLTTPNIGAATGTSLLVSGNVDGTAPVTVTTGSTATLGGTFKSGYTFNQEATAATAVAYTLPTAAAGRQYCVSNSYNGSAATTGVLTVNASATGQFIIWTDGTLSATGGNVTSGGAAGDAACFVGVDSTHWQIYVQRGTWTKH